MEPEWNISHQEHDAYKLGIKENDGAIELYTLINTYGMNQILRWMADYTTLHLNKNS
jgi:hypothetical protein